MLSESLTSYPLQLSNFQNNIARYVQTYNPFFNEAVKYEPAGTVEALQNEDGHLVLKKDGRFVNSIIDPLGEARELEDPDSSWADIAPYVVVYGLHNGYFLEEIARQAPESQIICIEEDMDMLHACLSSRVLDVYPTWRLKIINKIDDLRIAWWYFYRAKRPLTALWDAYTARFQKDRLTALHEALGRFEQHASISDNTAAHRAETWSAYLLKHVQEMKDRPYIGNMAGLLRNYPAVVVGAGPSLDKNIGLLKELQGRALVIAVNSSYSALHAAGIRPDMVMCIESFDISSVFEGLPKDTLLVCYHTSHPNVVNSGFKYVATVSDTIPQFREFLSENGDFFALANGGSVSCAAYSMARALGCDPVVLVGQDLAYSERQYSSGSKFKDIQIEFDKDKHILEIKGDHAKDEIYKATNNSTPQRRMVYRMVRGWHGGEVPTTEDFLMFRDWFRDESTEAGLRGQRCLNATEGGMYIDGWEHVTLREAIEICAPGLREFPFLDLVSQCPENKVMVEKIPAAIEEIKRNIKELRKALAWWEQMINKRMGFNPLRVAEEKVYKIAYEIPLLHIVAKPHLTNIHFTAWEVPRGTEEQLEEMHYRKAAAVCQGIMNAVDSLQSMLM